MREEKVDDLGRVRGRYARARGSAPNHAHHRRARSGPETGREPEITGARGCGWLEYRICGSGCRTCLARGTVAVVAGTTQASVAVPPAHDDPTIARRWLG